jgi:hypothetical protein
MAKTPLTVSEQEIENSILLVRGEKVLLDSDLAQMYGVTTKVLVQAVQRNAKRFPSDFAYRLTLKEFRALRSQFVTSNSPSRGGRRYMPYAFTEQGVAMLSSVLRSERAVQVNIEIMRAFVRIRKIIAANADLARRLDELEKRVGTHDEQFVQVIRAIRDLMQPAAKPKQRRIGFHPPDADEVATQSSQRSSSASRRRRSSAKNARQ